MICIICGVEFDGYPTKKTCSKECKTKHETKTAKKWRHKYYGKPKERSKTSKEVAQKIVNLLLECPHALKRWMILVGSNPFYLPAKTVEVFKPSARK